ncbi:MAG: hypothetical protein IV084_00730 [Rugosibacter sp.]|nr:hypothetical protein [Rugosibacter sp.]
MLFASLSTRGAGFLTSLLIARLAGASALGTYSALVNTAASVATPFTQVLTNTATVLGSEGSRGEAENYRALAKASFFLALVLSFFSAVVLVLLYEFMLDGDAPNSLLLVTTGVFAVIGQVIGAVSLGFLYGAGEFMLASRISFLVAVVICLIAYPAIQNYGLHGALALLLPASLLPPVLMGARVLTRNRTANKVRKPRSEAGQDVRLRFARALPSVVAITINNGVNWFCTIYLAHSVFGVAGVGVVAVAAQWLNLMLIPATSWGGVSLKVLTDAIASGNEKTVWHASVGLMRKNFLVTIALAGSIALASGLIARAYGLSDTDVALLICVNALCAIVAAINNVFERFLLALDRQGWWLFFSLISFSAQMAVTVLFIAKGLWIVPVGVLVASIILCLLSYFGVSRALPMQMKEQK